MFEDLRDAFRDALDNFKHELSRDDVPPTVDRLFLAMQTELAQAHELVSSLERQIAEARAQVEGDRAEETTCRRRAEMAGRVGDQETERIALEYASRYERRRVVLERKVVALDEEHAVRVVEVTEMTARVEEAKSKRDHLAAAAGASDHDEALRAADELFDELDRMASAGDAESAASASAGHGEYRSTLDELEREYRDLRVDPWAPIPRKELDVDAALEELKRRMKSS